MSPRSEEFMAAARECLRSAQAQVDLDLPSRAVGQAYYATLYAARAALSEQDEHAKTHSGTWSRFAELFVATGRFDRDLARFGSDLQAVREGADYEARAIPAEEAETAVHESERFVAAVLAMLER